MEVMEYAVREGLKCPYEAFHNAAWHGRLDMLQWMTPKMKTVDDLEYGFRPPVELATEAAAGNGHLDCLRWLVENDFRIRSRILLDAARGGHLACMQFAFESHAQNAHQMRCARDIAEKRQHDHICQWIDSVMHLADPIVSSDSDDDDGLENLWSEEEEIEDAHDHDEDNWDESSEW